MGVSKAFSSSVNFRRWYLALVILTVFTLLFVLAWQPAGRVSLPHQGRNQVQVLKSAPTLPWQKRLETTRDISKENLRILELEDNIELTQSRQRMFQHRTRFIDSSTSPAIERVAKTNSIAKAENKVNTPEEHDPTLRSQRLKDAARSGSNPAHRGDKQHGESESLPPERSAGADTEAPTVTSESGSQTADDGGRCESDRAAASADGGPCPAATRAGPGQSVISYSLFQTDNGTGRAWDRLLKGLDANAALSRRLYPGWWVRVHHDTAPDSTRGRRLAAVSCRHPHLQLCHIHQPPRPHDKGVYLGALWRFFPLTDPLVSVFVSRDLDSRLSQREADAVRDWLASNKTFHIMRDHWNHLMTMPGGLWGAKVAQRRGLMNSIGQKLAKWLQHPGHKNWDQRALQSAVWYDAAVDSVQHDSYTCQRFPGYTVPFPTRRDTSDTTLYLGQVVDPDGVGTDEKLLKCPVTCRPPAHTDWEYC